MKFCHKLVKSMMHFAVVFSNFRLKLLSWFIFWSKIFKISATDSLYFKSGAAQISIFLCVLLFIDMIDARQVVWLEILIKFFSFSSLSSDIYRFSGDSHIDVDGTEKKTRVSFIINFSFPTSNHMNRRRLLISATLLSYFLLLHGTALASGTTKIPKSDFRFTCFLTLAEY